MPSCYECKTRAQGPWSSLHRLFPNNAASLEASAVMTVEKKRAAEISQRPAPALNEPRKLHCNPNCGSWASPSAALVFDKAGNLYSTSGVVFALTPGAANGMWNEVALYSFDGGSYGGGLIID